MWTRELIQALIFKYETFPELWDFSSPLYKDKLKRQIAIENISSELNVPVRQVKSKIHILRTQYLQELRTRKPKRKSGKPAEERTSKWEFFDSLKFISPLKVTSRNVNSSLVTSSNKKISENLDGIPSTSQDQEIPSKSQEQEPRIKKKRRIMETPTSNEEIVSQKTPSVIDTPTKDENQVFGDFIASELRLLKSDRNRTLLRRKIQRVILDVSEKDAFGDSSSSWESKEPQSAELHYGNYTEFENTQNQSQCFLVCKEEN